MHWIWREQRNDRRRKISLEISAENWAKAQKWERVAIWGGVSTYTVVKYWVSVKAGMSLKTQWEGSKEIQKYN